MRRALRVTGRSALPEDAEEVTLHVTVESTGSAAPRQDAAGGADTSTCYLRFAVHEPLQQPRPAATGAGPMTLQSAVQPLLVQLPSFSIVDVDSAAEFALNICNGGGLRIHFEGAPVGEVGRWTRKKQMPLPAVLVPRLLAEKIVLHNQNLNTME